MNSPKRLPLSQICLAPPTDPQVSDLDRIPPHRPPSLDQPLRPGIELAAVWKLQDPELAAGVLSGELPGYAYRRDGHPNGDALAEPLKQLHGAERVLLTAQGQSALSSILLALLKPGDHALLGQPIYGGSQTTFNQTMAQWKVVPHAIPLDDHSSWESALQNSPALAIVETIANPTMQVPNLRWLATQCRQAKTLLVVDNTFATPLLCRPLELGADLVIESLTKLVSGHSDVMLGMIACREELAARIAPVLINLGMAASPLDCWLTRRGMATLPLRFERACHNALQLAEACRVHPMVERVDYPGLTSHPQHDIAKKLFGEHFGHMLTIHLKGDLQQASQFIDLVRDLAPFCPSLGDVQTTLSHPTSTSHRTASEAFLKQFGITPATLRISCGIEETEFLIDGFLNGLNRLPAHSDR